MAPLGECYYTLLPYVMISYVSAVIFFIVVCGIVQFLCTMHVFEFHSHTLCIICVSFAASVAELAHGEKSCTHPLNHPA